MSATSATNSNVYPRLPFDIYSFGLLSGSTASPFYCRYPVVRSFGKISLAMVSEQATNERVSLVVPTSKTTNQSNIGT